MLKDLVISLLAAGLIVSTGWFDILNPAEGFAVIIGIATAVFIFCLFLEDLIEKSRERSKRIVNLKQIVEEIANLKF